VKNKLWYNRPAEKWGDGLPLGNGRLGAWVLGQCALETIYLNEDTLWSGSPTAHTFPDVTANLTKIREHIFNKRYNDASELIKAHIAGDRFVESYMPMGELTIEMNNLTEITNYRCELDIARSVCITDFEANGTHFSRTVFCSNPDQCIVVRLESDTIFPGDISLRLTSKLRSFYSESVDCVRMTGWCPIYAEPDFYPNENPIIYGCAFLLAAKSFVML